MMIIKLIFFLSLGLILLMVLYPILTWIRSLLFPNPVIKLFINLPPVTIIIACRNEELFIRQKIDSFLEEDEWIEGSEIIVISNGSTDRTNDILARYANEPRVKIILESDHSSKIKSVNRGVKESQHDLLVFSDCRQMMKKGSVKQLISNFKDPEVGTVNATLADSLNAKRISFRSLLNFIAQCESMSGSSLNVFGALYAQRKTLFRAFPTDLLFDDLFVVVSTILQEKRLVCEKNAIIYDVSFEEYYGENRIQRLARGLLIFLFNHFDLIRCLPFPTLVRFMVFKYLKLILPFVFLFLSLAILCLIYLKGLQLYFFASVMTFIVLCAFEPVRRILSHLLKINYNFMIATIKFLFFNNRSNKWDKLKVSKTV